MKNFRFICFVFLTTLSILCKHNVAQTRIATTNYHGWYMYFGNHRLSDKWSLHTEYQWRRNQWIQNWQQSLARIGLDYHLNNQTIITFGYGNIITYPYGEQAIIKTFNEHRIWQTLLLTNKNGRFYFSHRYRVEQRFYDKFINNNGNVVFDRVVYSNRIRYLFAVIFPINKKILEKNALFFRFYEEAFVSFGKNVGKNIFDQNRLYFALGYQILPSSNIQAGYMNHLIFKADGVHYENNHTLQISITHNIDFRKKDSP